MTSPPNPSNATGALSSEVQSTITPSNLLYKARYIRDIIAPILARSPDAELAPHRLATLHDIFSSLESAPVTTQILEFSRIGKALFEVCSGDAKWPEEFVVRAEKQLRIWTAALGDITELTPLLWVPGGRMHGIERTRAVQQPRNPGKAERILGLEDGEQQAWEWSINLSHTKDPRSFGHHGFEVGEDGIIGNTGYITADEQGVYAMILTSNNTIDTGEGTILCEWNSMGGENESDAPDIRKLFRNITSHEAVRVLRTSELESKLAPVVGVRYDGLYRVARHGLQRDDEQLSLYFELARDSEQPDMSEALKRPRAEERDDSEFYHKIDNGRQ